MNKYFGKCIVRYVIKTNVKKGCGKCRSVYYCFQRMSGTRFGNWCIQNICNDEQERILEKVWNGDA